MPAPSPTDSDLRELADIILDYFSSDAAYWRPQFIQSSASGPLSVRFAFRPPAPEYAATLLHAITELLAPGYTAEEAQPANALSLPTSDEAADATVTFYPREQDGSSGIGYDISFRESAEVWWGWFALNV